MKIHDIYKIPTLETFENDLWCWDIPSCIFEDLIGFNEYDLDTNKAQESKDTFGKDFLVEKKLFKNQDGERTVSYNAYSYKGKYFALSVTSGRGEQDNYSLYVTDRKTLDIVREESRKFRTIDQDKTYEYDENEDIKNLNSEYGYLVHLDEKDNRFKLIDPDNCFITRKDNPIQNAVYVFDEADYREKFESIIRPMLNKFGYDNAYKNKEIIKSYCNIVLETLRIPDEDKKIVDIQDFKQKGLYKDNCIVAFKKDGECHGIFTDKRGSGIYWMFEHSISYIGDESVYQNLEKTHKPSKSLDM